MENCVGKDIRVHKILLSIIQCTVVKPYNLTTSKERNLIYKWFAAPGTGAVLEKGQPYHIKKYSRPMFCLRIE